MTKRETERQAWREYYIRISQYERWRDFRSMSFYFVRNLKIRVRGISDVEDDSALQEVIRVAEGLNALVQEYAGKYCTVKPEKPLGCPYGPDL